MAAAAASEAGIDALVRAADAIGGALRQGGRVLVFGNGGSAAEAQHFAAELVGRFGRERRALAAIALTTDTSILTAIANDYAFDQVFARQVAALGRAGDVALGISTSGRSGNVIRALQAARDSQLTTVGMTGGDGGSIGQMVDIHLNVPVASTPRVQEVQLLQLHVICDLVERDLAAGT
jgi:D-sedoheptulose 7-phosphate isomerase